MPVGNAAGDLVASWLNPTSIVIGVLAVATGAYLAAVYLAADARRIGDEELAQAFRRRALAPGVVAGALARRRPGRRARRRARALRRPTSGAGPRGARGVGRRRAGDARAARGAPRFEPARYAAAARGRRDRRRLGARAAAELLPGLTVQEAAAGRSTLVALVVGVLAGSLILFRRLALLFRLVLRGAFDARGRTARTERHPRHPLRPPDAACPRVLTTAGTVATGLALFGGGWREPLGIAVLLIVAAAGSVGLVWLALSATTTTSTFPTVRPPGGGTREGMSSARRPARERHPATPASASTWCGRSVSRAITSRWICDVPS